MGGPEAKIEFDVLPAFTPAGTKAMRLAARRYVSTMTAVTDRELRAMGQTSEKLNQGLIRAVVLNAISAALAVTSDRTPETDNDTFDWTISTVAGVASGCAAALKLSVEDEGAKKMLLDLFFKVFTGETDLQGLADVEAQGNG